MQICVGRSIILSNTGDAEALVNEFSSNLEAKGEGDRFFLKKDLIFLPSAHNSPAPSSISCSVIYLAVKQYIKKSCNT
jgi:hypothetical protein